MKAEDAHQMVKDATERLAEALKMGRSEQLRDYLQAMARFPTYSLRNVMLILMQRPDATRVAGYRAWQSLGRQVRKTEKSLTILAPIVIRRKPKQEQMDTDDKNCVVAFKAVRVFEISQTEGAPLPEFALATGEPGEYAERLRNLINHHGVKIEHSDRLGGAEGMTDGKRILVKQGLSPAEETSVLLHELAHTMLHIGKDKPESRTVREVEAEAVAFIVGESLGLQCIRSSCDYIHLYNGSSDTLMASLERIQRTAATIIRGILAESTLEGAPISVPVPQASVGQAA